MGANRPKRSYRNKANMIRERANGANTMIREMAMVGITINEWSAEDFDLDLNKWKALPDTIAEGVDAMALKLDKDLSRVVTKLAPGASILPHRNNKEFEYIKVLSGSVMDKFTRKEIKAGDTYTIERGIESHLVAEDGAKLIMVMAHTEQFEGELF